MNKYDALALKLLKELQAKAATEGLNEQTEETIDYLWNLARKLHRRGNTLAQHSTDDEVNNIMLQTQAE